MSTFQQRVNRLPVHALYDAIAHAVMFLISVIVAVVAWRSGRQGVAMGCVFFAGAGFGIIWSLIAPRLWPPPPRHRRPRGARRPQ